MGITQSEFEIGIDVPACREFESAHAGLICVDPTGVAFACFLIFVADDLVLDAGVIKGQVNVPVRLFQRDADIRAAAALGLQVGVATVVRESGVVPCQLPCAGRHEALAGRGVHGHHRRKVVLDTRARAELVECPALRRIVGQQGRRQGGQLEAVITSTHVHVGLIVIECHMLLRVDGSRLQLAVGVVNRCGTEQVADRSGLGLVVIHTIHQLVAIRPGPFILELCALPGDFCIEIQRALAAWRRLVSSVGFLAGIDSRAQRMLPHHPLELGTVQIALHILDSRLAVILRPGTRVPNIIAARHICTSVKCPARSKFKTEPESVTVLSGSAVVPARAIAGLVVTLLLP